MKEQQLDEENLLAGLYLILDKIEREQIVFTDVTHSLPEMGNALLLLCNYASIKQSRNLSRRNILKATKQKMGRGPWARPC